MNSSPHIDSDTAFRHGRPRLAGTRLAVADVVVMHLRLGMAPAEIAGRYDVPLAAVHAALAHYFDHRDDIDRDIEEDAAYAEAFRRANPSPLRKTILVSLVSCLAVAATAAAQPPAAPSPTRPVKPTRSSPATR